LKLRVCDFVCSCLFVFPCSIFPSAYFLLSWPTQTRSQFMRSPLLLQGLPAVNVLSVQTHPSQDMNCSACIPVPTRLMKARPVDGCAPNVMIAICLLRHQ
jgi:hypothetical protein